MGIAILVGLVVILFVVGIFAYLITIYNSLVRLKNDIDKAWANIDVLLKQRHEHRDPLSWILTEPRFFPPTAEEAATRLEIIPRDGDRADRA